VKLEREWRVASGECGLEQKERRELKMEAHLEEKPKTKHVSVREALAAHPVFADTDTEALEALLPEARLVDLPSEVSVYRSGRPASHVYVVIDGSVRLHHKVSDREITIAHMTAPCIVGDTDITSRSSHDYSCSAQTLIPSQLVQIPAASFLEFLKRAPLSGYLLARDLSTRCRQAYALARGSLFPVPVRLADYILMMAQWAGRETSNGVLIKHSMKYGDMAAAVGVNYESVKRAMRSWKQRGWLTYHKGWMVVMDPQALAQLREGAAFRLSLQGRRRPAPVPMGRELTPIELAPSPY